MPNKSPLSVALLNAWKREQLKGAYATSSNLLSVNVNSILNPIIFFQHENSHVAIEFLFLSCIQSKSNAMLT